nr:toxin-antitoxin system YwqK family antitoxin [Candidatus Enterousia merdequi]
MKKIVCLIGCLIIFAGCENKPEYVFGKNVQCTQNVDNVLLCKDNQGKAINGMVVVYNDAGQVSDTFKVKNGLQNGIIKSFFESGKIKRKQQVKHGKLYGLDTEFYQNGNKKREYKYKDGKAYGVYKEFFENGKIKIKRDYKDGQVDGNEFWYYETGEVLLQASYKNGKRITPMKFFYESGAIKAEWERRTNNKIDGYAKTYYENGKLESELFYKDGKIDGEGKRYDVNGRLESEETYDNDVLKKKYVYKYDVDGSLLYKEIYNGKKETGIEYNGETITRKQLETKLKEKKFLSDIADCEQATQKAANARKAMPKDDFIVFKWMAIMTADGIMTNGIRLSVVDFSNNGVFLNWGNKRIFVYTSDKDYATGDYFNPKNVIYKRDGNYKYSTLFGGIQSVPAYKPTNYKISSIDPRTYLNNKELSCCQYSSDTYKYFKETGIATQKSYIRKGMSMSYDASGCATSNHLKGYSGQYAIFTGID